MFWVASFYYPNYGRGTSFTPPFDYYNKKLHYGAYFFIYNPGNFITYYKLDRCYFFLLHTLCLFCLYSLIWLILLRLCVWNWEGSKLNRLRLTCLKRILSLLLSKVITTSLGSFVWLAGYIKCRGSIWLLRSCTCIKTCNWSTVCERTRSVCSRELEGRIGLLFWDPIINLSC